MNIYEKLKIIKSHINDMAIVFIILLVGAISFGLGRISIISDSKVPVTVSLASVNSNDISTTNPDLTAEEKLYVASKNGTKYHYPWCSGAQRINEENKIWFSTKDEAEKAGYTPAANCKGL